MAKWLLPLVIMLSSCVTSASSAETGVADICEIDSSPENFIGETVFIDAHVMLDHHGTYINGEGCDEAYVWTGLADPNDRELMRSLFKVGSSDGETPPLARLKVHIVMRDYHLPLTDHVSPRLKFEVIEVVTNGATE